MYKFIVLDRNYMNVMYTSDDYEKCCDYVEACFSVYHDCESLAVYRIAGELVEEEGDDNAKIHDSDC